MDAKSQKIDICLMIPLIFDAFPKFEFQFRSIKIDVACMTALLFDSLPRLESEAKSAKIVMVLMFDVVQSRGSNLMQNLQNHYFCRIVLIFVVLLRLEFASWLKVQSLLNVFFCA